MMEKTTEKRFFGQPMGLVPLFFTEFWERFSYYGMRAILLYFMYYSVQKGGLGLDIATASSIMAIYGSLVYFSDIFGGFLADRIWGLYKTVFYGGILIMFGHIALALPLGLTGLFLSMVLIIVGTGLLKPNISTQVGELYEENDRRRDSGFSIFVFGINLGSFVAPFIVGMAPKQFSFHVGFSFAAIGMFIGLIFYAVQSKKYLPESTFTPVSPLTADEKKPFAIKVLIGAAIVAAGLAVMKFSGLLTINNLINVMSIIVILVPIFYFIMMIQSKKVTKIERSRVISYIPLFIAGAVFWGLEEQGSVVLAQFADQRTAYPDWFSPAWFQSLNPLFIMLYTPIAVMLWNNWKKQPSIPTKFSIGLLFAGASFMLMALPGWLYGTDVKVAPWWLVASWALIIVGEILISPVGLSATTKLAPKAFGAQMMSLWFMANAFGQAVNAQIVKLYSADTEVAYFLWVGIFAAGIGILLLFFVPSLKRLMQGVK